VRVHSHDGEPEFDLEPAVRDEHIARLRSQL
jgi:hypothetical protein